MNTNFSSSSSSRRFDNDLNQNGIPDSMERKGFSSDMNGNGIPDRFEQGLNNKLGGLDLNRNGIPDKYERKGFSNDLNGNGIPDSLERNKWSSDLNGNGIPDKFERKWSSGSSNDLNRNGIPDNLERRSFNDLNGNGIPDNLERRSFNDLDGNGIPDSLEGGRTWTSSSSYTSGLQSGMSRGLSTTNVVQVQLPVQVRENAAVVHEEIRQERVEEIQPVVNIEKLKTEVHQVTQPLLDKEIKAVNLEQRVLPTQVLPEIITPGGIAAARDVSTVNYLQTQQIVVEKPALYQEVDKTQIIEEIQPVIYRETVVPTLIKETKPVFQKIVEGPVYVSETLPVQSLSGSHFTYPENYMATATTTRFVAPVQPVVLPVVQPVVVPIAKEVPHHQKIIDETVKKTTTTTIAPPNSQIAM